MNRYLYFLLIFILPSCNIDKSNLISASDFNQMIKNDKSAIIIDVRTPEEFNKGHLRNALNINWFDKNFDENLSKTVKNGVGRLLNIVHLNIAIYRYPNNHDISR